MMESRALKRLVYVQVSAERILLRRVATGAVVEDVPQVALDPQGNVTAIGRAAEEAARWHPDLRLVNGFSHPRCLLGDMEAATRTLSFFLLQLVNPRQRRWGALKPDLVIHPLGVDDLSGLEAWGLQRIAQLAGARSVRLWLGEEPAYETLARGAAQASGSFRAIALPRAGRRRKG